MSTAFPPTAFPPITIARRLNHTGGLPGGSADDGEGDPAPHVVQRFGHLTPAQVVAEMDGQSMSFAPGTEQQDNGENYYLLGMPIERVTSRSYGDEVTDRIPRPLHLRDTEVPAATDHGVPGPHPHGYLNVPEGDSLIPVDVTRQSPCPRAG